MSEHEKVDQRIIDEIRGKLPEYLGDITQRSPKAGKDFYICPFCGSGSGSKGTGALKYDPEKNLWRCYSCGREGDIFNAISYRENLPQPGEGKDFIPVLNRALEIFGYQKPGISSENGSQRPENNRKENTSTSSSEEQKGQNQASQPEKKDKKDRYKDYIERSISHVSETDYFSGERGLSEETIGLFRLGYDPGKQSIVIPYGLDNSYYITRSVSGKTFRKPKSEDPEEKEPVFDPLYYLGDPSEPVYICESALDAMSIVQSGGRAVALNGTGYDKLLPRIEDRKATDQPLILCFDNDPPNDKGHRPGPEAQERLGKELEKKHIPYINAIFNYKRYRSNYPQKDANDLLRNDPDQLRKDIEDMKRLSSKPENVFDYIRLDLSKDIEDIRSEQGRKTGFSNLDEKLGSLYSGLYIIAGASSVGKTSFCGMLADNLAKSGQHVLFFSLEMSRFELIAKTLAREMYLLHASNPLTAREIREGKSSEDILRAGEAYRETVGSNLSIIEGNLSTTVEDIEEKTRAYIARNKIKPCLIIDYLQIIPPSKDPETGRKPSDSREITEKNVVALKRLSRDLSIPIIVISSLNRQNYLTPISFEALKETGLLEYSSDIVFGLQLAAVNSEKITGNSTLAIKRKFLSEAKKNPDRKVELINLKNRYGPSEWSVYFNYKPARDVYIEHPGEFREDELVAYFTQQEDPIGEGYVAPGEDPYDPLR
ncbi:MAG: toprim domain-containing protein [Oscillospiraceae bacterium]|nr:toprim domain-containing protein [Oscillospiraceae bacterium]